MVSTKIGHSVLVADRAIKSDVLHRVVGIHWTSCKGHVLWRKSLDAVDSSPKGWNKGTALVVRGRKDASR